MRNLQNAEGIEIETGKGLRRGQSPRQLFRQRNNRPLHQSRTCMTSVTFCRATSVSRGRFSEPAPRTLAISLMRLNPGGVSLATIRAKKHHLVTIALRDRTHGQITTQMLLGLHRALRKISTRMFPIVQTHNQPADQQKHDQVKAQSTSQHRTPHFTVNPQHLS